MQSKVRSLVAPLLCAGLLTACGGGVSLVFGDFDDEFDDVFDTRPSGRSASLTVSAASENRFDGTYASADVWLSNVLRFSRAVPDTCRFRFAGLQQAGTGRLMDGEIRYLPVSGEPRTVFIWIEAFEFRHDGTTGVAVDFANNRVTFSGAVLVSTQSGAQITLAGTVPIRGDAKESGC